MSTTDLSLNGLCQQRKKQMLFNVPPMRFNPISPYSGNANITSFKLDMRRKAEILQYNANKTNTKTNNFTKAEKWLLLINGKNQKKTYNDIKISQVYYTQSNISSNIYSDGNIVINNSDKYSLEGIYNEIIVKYPDTYTTNNDNGNIIYNIVKGNIPNCNTDMIPVPTTSSDVPGKAINLIRDVSIPIYNYNNPITYGIINPANISNYNYNYIINKNILFNNNVENTLFSLNILDNNDNYRNNFSFEVPVYMSFQNNTTENLNSSNITDDIIDKFKDLRITVTNVLMNVFYNNSIIFSNTLTNFSSSIDVSLNNSIITPFSGNIYIGMITFPDILVYTQPGYVYDIKLTCKIDDNINSIISNNTILAEYSNQITINKTLIFNSSYVNKDANGCTIKTPPSSNENRGFILRGY